MGSLIRRCRQRSTMKPQGTVVGGPDEAPKGPREKRRSDKRQRWRMRPKKSMALTTDVLF